MDYCGFDTVEVQFQASGVFREVNYGLSIFLVKMFRNYFLESGNTIIKKV